MQYFTSCKTVRLIGLVISLLNVSIAIAHQETDTQLKEHIASLQKEPVQSTAMDHQASFQPQQRVNQTVAKKRNAQEDARHVLNEQAFEEALKNTLPLSGQQITRLRKQFNETQAAMSANPDVPPNPVIASRSINLSPGSTPMVIRLAQGYVSTLAFLDSTGQPWPIERYNIGDPQAFNVQWDKQSNLIMIQATTLYNTGNLAVQLKDLHVPVMLSLVSGQKEVDYRLDMRVQGIGPRAKPLLGRSLPEHISTELLGILDGIPPANSKPLQVQGSTAQAWLAENRIYLRTRLTILSPAWLATVSSLDGMKAYELPKTSLILGSSDGVTLQLKLKGL